MLKQRILKWIIPKLLIKKSPHRIPRSGKAGESMDCYAIYICGQDKNPLHLVEDINKTNGELSTFTLDQNDTFSVRGTLDINELSPDSLSVIHYYNLYDLNYTNIYDLAFKFIFKVDVIKVKFKIFWNYLSQSRFNKKNLVTKKTIELLEFIVDHQLNGNISRSDSYRAQQIEGTNHIFLMTELYSLRWVSHPHSNNQMKKLMLYLDSLTESGDLQRRDGKYFVTGKALKTLEQYEENERRHKDAVGIQKKIFWLTMIIAFAAIIEAKLIDLPPILDWPHTLSGHIKSFIN